MSGNPAYNDVRLPRSSNKPSGRVVKSLSSSSLGGVENARQHNTEDKTVALRV